MKSTATLALAFLLLGVVFCGCSDRPTTYTVTGTVTYHGKPVEAQP